MIENDRPLAIPPDNSKIQRHSRIWARWWIRSIFLIVHLAVMLNLLFLTPEGYHSQLGADFGWLILLVTIAMWVLLYHARTRILILLFCNLMLLQAGLAWLVNRPYHTEAKMLQEILGEQTKIRINFQIQIATLHMERIFKMLTAGNKFSLNELRDQLNRTKQAIVLTRQIQTQVNDYVGEAEKRISQVSKRAARQYRESFERAKSKNEMEMKLLQDFLTGIESLTSFLIERQGYYQFDKSQLIFEQEKDANTYNQMTTTLAKMGEEITKKTPSNLEWLQNAVR